MVAAGEFHSMLLTSSGKVFTWGRNNRGQLGDGTVNLSETPIDITSQFSGRVVKIATGDLHSFALTQDGTFYAWGQNAFTGFTDDRETFHTTPVDTTGLLPERITSLAVGAGHYLALTEGGRLFSWGENDHGQLGNGSTGDSSSPVEITGSIRGEVTSIAAGRNHSLAITSDGRLWSWGRNNVGQLGNSENCGNCNRLLPQDQSHHLPTSGIKSVAAAYDHSLAVTSDGVTLTWGFNVYGQLGNGSIDRSPSPSDISGRIPGAVKSVLTATTHSLALTESGSLFSWGDNRYGKLGNGSKSRSLTPIGLSSRIQGSVNSAAAGTEHSLAVTGTGRVYAWGDNTHGQLGDGTRNESSVPIDITWTVTGSIAEQLSHP